MPPRAKGSEKSGREKVLAAGLELFGSRGYDATSIADIGKHAVIAKSVIYHYFGSKAGLYRTIVEAENRALLEQVHDALPAEAEAPRLRAGVDAYLGFLVAQPHSWRLLLRDPPADPKLRELHRRLATERSDALAGLLAKPAKLAGEGQHVELIATAIRAFAIWWYDHRDVPQEEVAEAILDVAEAAAKRISRAQS